MIALVIFLALLFMFMALTDFSLASLLMGSVLSFFLMALIPTLPRVRPIPALATGAQILQFGTNILHFIWDFLKDLTISNIQIAWDIWTPRDHYDPILIFVPVGDLTPLEVMVLSSRITLTPGTLSCDVTADREYLIVHVMYTSGKDPATIVAGLRGPIDLLKKGIE